MTRRARHTGTTAAVLLLFAACLATREGAESCSCRPVVDTAASGADAPVAPPASASTALESTTTSTTEAAAPAALPDFDDPVWTRVPSRAGRYLVCWRSTSGKVPRNEDFELEVWVLRDGAPVRAAELAVSGWMPEHGHGMLRLPRTERRADGSFRVEGMLLHMRGHWQLRFDVVEDAQAETAECALEL